MSQLILSQQTTAPSAPSTGKVSVYVDSNGDLSWKDAAGNITKLAAAGAYTLTLNSSGTLALGGNTLTVAGGNPTVTGAGTLATGGYTLTVPATGTAALVGTNNAFSVGQTVNGIDFGATTNDGLSKPRAGEFLFKLGTSFSLLANGANTVDI